MTINLHNIDFSMQPKGKAHAKKTSLHQIPVAVQFIESPCTAMNEKSHDKTRTLRGHQFRTLIP